MTIKELKSHLSDLGLEYNDMDVVVYNQFDEYYEGLSIEGIVTINDYGTPNYKGKEAYCLKRRD